MAREIGESDWKLLRRLHPAALDRFCGRVLSEVGRLASVTGKCSHERYRAVVERIERRDGERADAFDDLRRSTALVRLACIRSHGLLTEEFARFNPETRDAVQLLLATE